ncbi:hypothetical protein NKG94_29255 [Micromonospora sp. M12]
MRSAAAPSRSPYSPRCSASRSPYRSCPSAEPAGGGRRPGRHRAGLRQRRPAGLRAAGARGLLPDVVGPARQALGLMAAKLPNAPVRAVETERVTFWAMLEPDMAPPRHSADALVFDTPTIDRFGRADLSGDYFLPSLLEAVWRQDCGDQPILGDVYRARMVAAAWLTGRPPAPQPGWAPEEMALLESAYQALVSLPEAEQRRRLAAAREGALACRDDELVAIMSEDRP